MTDYGKSRATEGKKPKKIVGRIEKEKMRKKRTESRLAQRTGKSSKDRMIENFIDRIKKGSNDKLLEYLKKKKKLFPKDFDV